MKSVWQSEFSAQRENDAARARVAACYRERWLCHYAASKLRADPVFSAAVNLLRESPAPLLDLGCGIGLLPFYLRECGFKPPIIGLEIDARKIQRARAAAESQYRAIEFFEGDVSEELPVFSGNVALVDVLHYLEREQQLRLLCNIASRISPGGMLLVRDSPRENSLRFFMTYLGEIFAQTISWNIGGRLHFPTRESIHESFDEEFDREEHPMWGGSPFNNRLFVFRRRSPQVRS